MAVDEIVFFLIEGDPVCVHCAWELRASGASPVWWIGHVLPVTDQMLITGPGRQTLERLSAGAGRSSWSARRHNQTSPAWAGRGLGKNSTERRG